MIILIMFYTVELIHIKAILTVQLFYPQHRATPPRVGRRSGVCGDRATPPARRSPVRGGVAIAQPPPPPPRDNCLERLHLSAV